MLPMSSRMVPADLTELVPLLEREPTQQAHHEQNKMEDVSSADHDYQQTSSIQS